VTILSMVSGMLELESKVSINGVGVARAVMAIMERSIIMPKGVL